MTTGRPWATKPTWPTRRGVEDGVDRRLVVGRRWGSGVRWSAPSGARCARRWSRAARLPPRSWLGNQWVATAMRFQALMATMASSSWASSASAKCAAASAQTASGHAALAEAGDGVGEGEGGPLAWGEERPTRASRRGWRGGGRPRPAAGVGRVHGRGSRRSRSAVRRGCWTSSRRRGRARWRGRRRPWPGRRPAPPARPPGGARWWRGGR